MSAVLLFFFYFILLVLIIQRVFKRKRIEINSGLVVFIFAFKVLLGCLYGYVFLKYYGGDDTWMFYRDSLTEYQKLIHQPGLFIKDFFPGSPLGPGLGSWQGWRHYLQDLEYWMMLKLLAIFNIFSRGNYYIDVLFFDFVVLWGPVLVFKLLLFFFPNKKNILVVTLFFIPSIGFWLSGIRAEGLLVLFIGLISYYSYQWYLKKEILRFWWIVAGFTGFLIFREQYLLAFLLPFFCWIISIRNPLKAIYYFIIGYVSALFIFLGSLIISPEKNLSAPLIARQQEFLQLHGNTRFRLDSLQPSIQSFIKIFPQAFANTFLRPFFWEAKSPLQMMASLETIGFWVLIVLFIIYPEKDWKKILLQPLILLFLFYGVSQILLIGYVVPFPGAVVRYKSIPELLLTISLALAIKWRDIYKLK
jgi:hypothetical protein